MLMEEVREPVQFLCYHCGAEKRPLLRCEIWEIGTCVQCYESFHQPHHKTCKREAPKSGSALRPTGPRYFSLNLTRFDGSPVRIQCELGQEIHMEDHWLGTYIYLSNGMVLVLEDRKEINEKILEGLKGIQHTETPLMGRS